MVLSLCGGFQPRGGISGPGLAGSAPGAAANCSSTIGARDDEWPRKNSGPPELSRPRSSQRSWKSHLYSHAMARSSRSASPSCALTGSARAHALRRIFGGNWIRKCLTSSRSSLRQTASHPSEADMQRPERSTEALENSRHAARLCGDDVHPPDIMFRRRSGRRADWAAGGQHRSRTPAALRRARRGLSSVR